MALVGVSLDRDQALVDPSAGALMRAHAPRVVEWCTRMLSPRAASGDGGWETWEALQPTMGPILARHVRVFLEWSVANTAAIEGGDKEMTCELTGYGRWGPQKVGGPQKYQRKSLKVIRTKHAAVAGDAGLAAVLERAGLRGLLATAASKL